jgi:hypothetical protein
MKSFGLSLLTLNSVKKHTVALAIFGCVVPQCVTEPKSGVFTIANNAIVAGTASSDYSTGNIGFLNIETKTATKNCITVFSDNVVKTYRRSVYLLERSGKDNLLRFEEGKLGEGALLYQKNLGKNINITDIAFVDDEKAYISCNLSKFLLVINPQTGSATDSIDLSAFNAFPHTSDSATIPYMQSLALYHGKLYVSCQRLKVDNQGYPQPADSSVIAIITVAENTLSGSIILTRKNPASMEILGDKLYVVSTGTWGDASDGGIERIDCASGTNEGVIIEEQKFGGDISTLCCINAEKAYVAVAKNSLDYTSFWTELVAFNPAGGTVGEKVDSIENAFGGTVFDGRLLYVGDRSKTAPGIVVVDPATNKKVGGPYDTGLPPGSLAYLKME